MIIDLPGLANRVYKVVSLEFPPLKRAVCVSAYVVLRVHRP
jgi:hypothetical protein